MTKMLSAATSSTIDVFKKLSEESAGRPPLEIDLGAVQSAEALLEAPLGEEQVRAAEDQLRELEDLIEAGNRALKRLSENPRHAATIEYLKSRFQEADPNLDGMLLSLLRSDEFSPVIELGGTKKGVKGFSLGVYAEYGLLAGRRGWYGGVGVDGIWVYSYKVGTYKVPEKFWTRKWHDTKLTGFDVGASAGVLVMSVWLNQPVSAKVLGIFVNAVPVLRLQLFGWVPSVNLAAADLGKVHPTKYIFGVTWSYLGTLNPLIGLEIGGGILHAYQNLHQVLTGASLTVTNSVTLTNNFVIGVECPQLSFVITPPSRGGTPNRLFRNYSYVNDEGLTQTVQSQITVTLPLFLQYVTTGSLTVPATPSGWSIDTAESTSGVFVMLYSGADQAAWTDDLTFYFSSITASSTSAQSNTKIKVKLENVETTGVVDWDNRTFEIAFPLVNEAFTGSLSYSVQADASSTIDIIDSDGNVVETHTGSYTPKTSSGAAASFSVASTDDSTSFSDGFQYLPAIYNGSQSGYRVRVTDSTGQPWYLGFVFEQNSGSKNANTAYMEGVWWTGGTPIKYKSYWTTNSYTLSSATPTTLTSYCQNDTGSGNYFTLSATAAGIYASSSQTGERAPCEPCRDKQSDQSINKIEMGGIMSHDTKTAETLASNRALLGMVDRLAGITKQVLARRATPDRGELARRKPQLADIKSAVQQGKLQAASDGLALVKMSINDVMQHAIAMQGLAEELFNTVPLSFVTSGKESARKTLKAVLDRPDYRSRFFPPQGAEEAGSARWGTCKSVLDAQIAHIVLSILGVLILDVGVAYAIEIDNIADPQEKKLKLTILAVSAIWELILFIIEAIEIADSYENCRNSG
jgi:hypothetical protein